jgi:alkyl hydroperoxide reductase subunit AhpC
VLGLSVDHPTSHEAFARDAGIHFSLLADHQPRGLVARQFGVLRQAQGVGARALFVLDPRLVVRSSNAYPGLLNRGVDDVPTTLESLGHDHEVKLNGGV